MCKGEVFKHILMISTLDVHGDDLRLFAKCSCLPNGYMGFSTWL